MNQLHIEIGFRRLLIIVGMLILAYYLNVSTNTYAQPLVSDIQEETVDNSQIVETIFRHLASEHSSDWYERIHFYLLCVDSSHVDSSASSRFGISHAGSRRDIDELMFKRLSDLPHPLKKLSECTFLSMIPGDSRGGVIDSVSRRRGIMYIVGEQFHWIDQVSVQVYARYYYQGRAAGGWVFDLKKQKDKWIVTKMDLIWVS